MRHAGSVGQSMMYGWNETGRQPEASWNEFSAIYRAFFKRVSVSEIDKEERPVCYACVPSNTSVEKTILDFAPITFLSCFFIQTAKGMGVISGVVRPLFSLHTKMNVNYVYIFSTYRAVNTLRLGCTNQSMLYREIIGDCSQIHTKHINTLCGQNVELYVPRSKHTPSRL